MGGRRSPAALALPFISEQHLIDVFLDTSPLVAWAIAKLLRYDGIVWKLAGRLKEVHVEFGLARNDVYFSASSCHLRAEKTPGTG